MDTAATYSFEYSLQRVLCMAIELDNNQWKLGFTPGFGQPPREQNVASRDRVALERENRSTQPRCHLMGDCRVLSCYEAGRDSFWLHRYLIHHGINSLKRVGNASRPE
ncbi:MAG: hypothetical protein P1P76_04830 [Anaerolineales bacterium]|nr:hypothetical protein [Anaerolineales bacterium]